MRKQRKGECVELKKETKRNHRTPRNKKSRKKESQEERRRVGERERENERDREVQCGAVWIDGSVCSTGG